MKEVDFIIMARLSNVKTFDYNDVMLIPQECKVNSRSEVDTSLTIGDRDFKIPVVPANMSSVIDRDLALKLADNGYFYIMHRFDVDPVEFAQYMHGNNSFASISLGVQDKDYDVVRHLSSLDKPVEYITIDIAHGDTVRVFDLIREIRKYSPTSYIIAGNVANPDAVKRLEEAGASAVKVGVAPGSACLTGPNTGFGSRGWQLSAVQWCAEAANDVDIIADGGVKEFGDIAKSIAFGADYVMIGGMFAGHDESPGNIIIDSDGLEYKEFFGSASANQKGDNHHVEGKNILVKTKGSIFDTLNIIEEHLQSSISYAGGTELNDLYNTDYVLLNR